METSAAASLFAALGHPRRLKVWRLLQRRLPAGGQPGEMAEALDMKPNTLSHHLSDLEAAGLIRGEARGRGRFYTAIEGQAARIGAYVLDDCGRGRESPMPAPGRGPWNVLFLCTENAARSLMAESVLNLLGQGRFRAHSAGSKPSRPDPQALALLRRQGYDTAPLRSKPVAEYQVDNAPRFDFVFTLCDRAVVEDCPPWPGGPVSAHWGLPDPARVAGDTERALAFAEAYATLHRRISAFAALSPDALDRLTLQHDIDRIARS